MYNIVDYKTKNIYIYITHILIIYSPCVSMMFETVKSDSLTVYPQNSQFALHWREFLGGYRSTESVETKFPFSDSSRALRVNSIGFVDGQTKVLIMVSILAMCHELDTWLDMKT